ncbi:hypothetical protein JKP88DRAFT_347792 [Tribonema minus]|uniref:GST C-terminal domain-containing protein n=1 Tax=Tribonema minus TaxID=303371 RepID=A0A836CM60_9STRA|nr:hypothetical protein JKP88DRAFT_347792 [Tribonema minus]
MTFLLCAADSRKDGIYATQPKLRIVGAGLPEDASQIALQFLDEDLKLGEVYTLSVAPPGLVLELLPGKQWASVEPGAPPVPLFLTNAKVRGEEVLVDGGIQVALVHCTPDVDAAPERIVYTTTPPSLVINGTAFNTKYTALFFDPPLGDGIDVSTLVLSPTQILLSKKFHHKWRADGPGPLSLVAIDTGGGRLALDMDRGGRVIAQVQADLEGHGVTVESHIYQSTPTLELDGAGFNPKGTSLRFANALRGGGANYTASAITPTHMTLELAPGSRWRGNADNLPGALVLLAADAGDGYVALGATAAKAGRKIAMVRMLHRDDSGGPLEGLQVAAMHVVALGTTAAKAGRKIATIFEDPSVQASSAQLFRTHSHTLPIRGAGFNDEPAPVFYFEGVDLAPRPPVKHPRGVALRCVALPSAAMHPRDYYASVHNRTYVELMLAGGGWLPAGRRGDLRVAALDTGAGKAARILNLRVAALDMGAGKMAERSWRRQLQLRVAALDTGAGKVTLLEPMTKALVVGDEAVTLAEPVTVARVVDDEDVDPSGVAVTPANDLVLYQSDTARALDICGSGFKGEPTLVFSPPLTKDKDYTFGAVSETAVSLRLVVGRKWRTTGGILLLVSAAVEGEDAARLGGGDGVKVATILTDPWVKERTLRIYASHSKHFTVQGGGFASKFDPALAPAVVFDSVPARVFTVQDWTDTTLQVSLVDGYEWARLSDNATSDIRVLSVDTGAGLVAVGEGGGGVHVVTVHADDEDTICEDTCIYANDGRCDEASGEYPDDGVDWGLSDDEANFRANSFSSSDPANVYAGISSDPANVYAGVSAFSSRGYVSDDVAFGHAECEPGTDCTDCGIQVAVDGTCTNTCRRHPRDGVCDDARGTGSCIIGTDCQDCGPVGASNFTSSSTLLSQGGGAGGGVDGEGSDGVVWTVLGSVRLYAAARKNMVGGCKSWGGAEGACGSGEGLPSLLPAGTLSVEHAHPGCGRRTCESGSYSDTTFLADNDWVLKGQAINAKAPYKRTFKDHVTAHQEREETGVLFMDILWGIVMTVGGTMGPRGGSGGGSGGGGGALERGDAQEAEDTDDRGSGAGFATDGVDFDKTSGTWTHTTKSGKVLREIIPKGSVPGLAMPDGTVVSEGIAVHIAIIPDFNQYLTSTNSQLQCNVPGLAMADGTVVSEGIAVHTAISNAAPDANLLGGPPGSAEHLLALEYFSFIATDIHAGSLNPMYFPNLMGIAEVKEYYVNKLKSKFATIAKLYLAGGKKTFFEGKITSPDLYLAWAIEAAKYHGIDVGPDMEAFHSHVTSLPAVKAATDECNAAMA